MISPKGGASRPNESTVYNMLVQNPVVMNAIATNTFLVSANGDNHELYDHAEQILNGSVLYNSTHPDDALRKRD